MTLQQPGVKPSGKHLAANPTQAQANQAVPDPAARLGSILGHLPAERLATPPLDDLDLEERTDVWVTSSKEVFDLKRQYDEHVNHMEWQRMWRSLVPCAGLLGMGTAAACLHRFLGLPWAATIEMTGGGVLATGGGVTLGILASVRRRVGPRRRQSDRDNSSS